MKMFAKCICIVVFWIMTPFSPIADTNVSEEHTVSIFRIGTPKVVGWHLFARLHDVITQKMIILTHTAVKPHIS
jgi:hypothetical protein